MFTKKNKKYKKRKGFSFDFKNHFGMQKTIILFFIFCEVTVNKCSLIKIIIVYKE